MKLLSLRLHPFGGTADRTIILHDGLNVLEGANEFGKSTMVEALWHVLFTPTEVAGRKRSEGLERWYPRTGGDHVRVTLTFLAGDRTWTLEKAWGPQGIRTSRLSDGTMDLAGATRVQQELQQLLQRGRATWQQVLFTRQEELTRTLEAMTKEVHGMDDLHGLLTAALPQDMPPELLAKALDDRITLHYQRWDRAAGGPEQGRGVEQAWERSLGTLLDAYYALERTRLERDGVRAFERNVDRVNSAIEAVERALAGDAARVAEGKPLRAGLQRRAVLDVQIPAQEKAVAQLMQVHATWSGAGAMATRRADESDRLRTEETALVHELRNANLLDKKNDILAGYAALNAARTALQEAREVLARTPAVDEVKLEKARRLRTALHECGIRIAAHRLAARIEAEEGAAHVTIQQGDAPPQTLSLAPGTPWTGEAPGDLVVRSAGLRITVRNAGDGLQELLALQERDTAELQALLVQLGHADVAAAEAAARAHAAGQQELDAQAKAYHIALRSRTEESWAQAMAELSTAQAARSVDAVQERQAVVKGRLRELEQEERTAVADEAAWHAAHTSPEQLMEKVMQAGAALGTMRAEHAGLPTLPQGAGSVDAYLSALDRAEKQADQLKEQLAALRVEQAGLLGKVPSRTAEELADELAVHTAQFEREKARGEALLRIRKTLEQVVAARRGGDPLEDLRTTLAGRFSALTGGRYSSVVTKGVVPTLVRGERMDLPAEHLSTGALGLLALTTRLALAGVYLRGMAGFLVLDDPFTELDPERRARAVEELAQLATAHQVLLLTCHPDHAAELLLAGARRVEMR